MRNVNSEQYKDVDNMYKPQELVAVQNSIFVIFVTGLHLTMPDGNGVINKALSRILNVDEDMLPWYIEKDKDV